MKIAGTPESPPVEPRRQIILVKCSLGLGKRHLQLDDAVREFDATAAAKQGRQHGMTVGGTDEPSP